MAGGGFNLADQFALIVVAVLCSGAVSKVLSRDAALVVTGVEHLLDAIIKELDGIIQGIISNLY